MSSDRYLRRDGLVRREVGPDLLLFDPSTDALHVLNPTCAALWEALVRPCSVVDLVTAIEQAFEVDEASDVRGDVDRALADLVERGLVREVDG